MNYRSEIDGLRALAVLPVIFFHAGFHFFKGGFVGVDVFFVISGYLITRIILEKLEQGTFSIRQFYARRARRILPPLFFVMLACIPFAFAWMLPSQSADFSRSLMAVVLFLSNVFFWRESGYFEAEAAEKPLLHTWSLGVEEQYYLLVPLALMMAWRWGHRAAFYAVLLASFVSFILCEYASHYAHSANFFLLPTRAWELGVGSLCAFMHVHRPAKKSELLAAIGLLFIFIAVIAYDERMRLPSAYTLLPVLGSALILLYATAGTFIARILSTRLLVGIGLISYSAYLWHQPLFAFARIHIPTTPPPLLMLFLSCVALLLGATTWRLIEHPFRDPRHRFYVSNRRALAMACTTVSLLMAVGIYGHATHGRLASWTAHADPSKARALHLLEEAIAASPFYDNGDCIFNVNAITDTATARFKQCQKKYGAGTAIIGDSHAINLFFMLKSSAPKSAFVVGIAQGLCRPEISQVNCYHDALLAMLEKNPQLFREIIHTQAGFHLLLTPDGTPVDRESVAGLPLDAAVPHFIPYTQSIETVVAYLTKLRRFAPVTWVGPRIEPHIRKSTVVQLGCDYKFQLRPEQAATYERLEAAIAKRLAGTSIAYRSQIAALKFDMAQDFISCDKTYFKDGDHYSFDGEIRFGKRLTLPSLEAKP